MADKIKKSAQSLSPNLHPDSQLHLALTVYSTDGWRASRRTSRTQTCTTILWPERATLTGALSSPLITSWRRRRLWSLRKSPCSPGMRQSTRSLLASRCRSGTPTTSPLMTSWVRSDRSGILVSGSELTPVNVSMRRCNRVRSKSVPSRSQDGQAVFPGHDPTWAGASHHLYLQTEEGEGLVAVRVPRRKRWDGAHGKQRSAPLSCRCRTRTEKMNACLISEGESGGRASSGDRRGGREKSSRTGTKRAWSSGETKVRSWTDCPPQAFWFYFYLRRVFVLLNLKALFTCNQWHERGLHVPPKHTFVLVHPCSLWHCRPTRFLPATSPHLDFCDSCFSLFWLSFALPPFFSPLCVLSSKSPGHQSHVVSESSEVHSLLHLAQLPLAHPEGPGAASAVANAGPLPLLNPRLPGQEDSGGLKCW